MTFANGLFDHCMSKIVFKVFIALTLILAQLGQVVSASASCDLFAEAHETAAHSTMPHHETMDHSHPVDAPMASDNCCDTECACPINYCSSLIYMIQEFKPLLMTPITHSVLRPISEQPVSVKTSLYRPPIFA